MNSKLLVSIAVMGLIALNSFAVVDTITGSRTLEKFVKTMVDENAVIVTSSEQVKYWDTKVNTLQSVIDGITDATLNKQYTIVVPPGRYTMTDLTNKPFVNIKGAGGRSRVTVFASGSLNLLAASLSGTSRMRVEGIRFETCPVRLINAAAVNTIVATFIDCAFNGNSPITTTGNEYGSAAKMVNAEFRDCSIENNTTSQKFELSKVTFVNSMCLGMYFTNSDAFFQGCDLAVAANVVNTGTAGGWFEFYGCRFATMAINDATSLSVLNTLCGGGSESVWIYGGIITGATANPNTISNWANINGGALYLSTAAGSEKLWVKTVRGGLWVVVGSQAP